MLWPGRYPPPEVSNSYSVRISSHSHPHSHPHSYSHLVDDASTCQLSFPARQKSSPPQLSSGHKPPPLGGGRGKTHATSDRCGDGGTLATGCSFSCSFLCSQVHSPSFFRIFRFLRWSRRLAEFATSCQLLICDWGVLTECRVVSYRVLRRQREWMPMDISPPAGLSRERLSIGEKYSVGRSSCNPLFLL